MKWLEETAHGEQEHGLVHSWLLSCLQSTEPKVITDPTPHTLCISPLPTGYADLSKGKHPQLCSRSFPLSLPVCPVFCAFSSLTPITSL